LTTLDVAMSVGGLGEVKGLVNDHSEFALSHAMKQ
jgi:hypothetical protein